MSPTTLSDVIFSEQANHNFSKILGDLKRFNLSITNRLRSIEQDSSFVRDVAEALGLPLVANERCGSWYIDPAHKAGSAYFKSTDGHTGQWKFSTRRLNLHLLELIGSRDGCIIVDSTRRGKRMPDALSKTIPIWCTILNRALFPSTSHALHVPPNVVSPTEKSQIEALLPSFLASFLALHPDLPSFLTKPLRPLWITHDDPLPASTMASASFHPVVCCTSSRRVVGTEISEAGYIQGAGDDTENWALGLTAPIFWAHRDELLGTAEADLPELIASLLASSDAREGVKSDLTQVAPGLFVGTLAVSREPLREEGACVVALLGKVTEKAGWVKGPSHLEVGLGRSKAGSRQLREGLPVVCEFVERYLARSAEEGGKKVVILCETGKEISVGVALALSCWCFDDGGNVRSGEGGGGTETFTKSFIRVRLGRIMTAMPEANPSRATLQSVNSFLMDWRK